MKEKKKRFKPPFRPKPGKKIRLKKKSDPYVPSTHESVAISTNQSEREAYNRRDDVPAKTPTVRAVDKSTREIILDKIKQKPTPARHRPQEPAAAPAAELEALVAKAALKIPKLTEAEKREAQIFLGRRIGAHLVDAWLVSLFSGWAVTVGVPSGWWTRPTFFWFPAFGLTDILVGIVYFGFCYQNLGATVGKMIFRLRLQMEKGGKVPWLRAYLRETIGKILAILPAGFGILMSLMREDRRALHDFVFGTRVVNASEASESAPAPRF